MNLLADESVGQHIVAHLRQVGHTVDAISELAPGVSDDEVLVRAVQAGSVLPTADKDFGDLVFRLGKKHRGIVLLRLAGLNEEARAKIVAEVMQQQAALLQDSFTVVTHDAVRVRPQPGSGPAAQ